MEAAGGMGGWSRGVLGKTEEFVVVVVVAVVERPRSRCAVGSTVERTRGAVGGAVEGTGGAVERTRGEVEKTRGAIKRTEVGKSGEVVEIARGMVESAGE